MSFARLFLRGSYAPTLFLRRSSTFPLRTAFEASPKRLADSVSSLRSHPLLLRFQKSDLLRVRDIYFRRSGSTPPRFSGRGLPPNGPLASLIRRLNGLPPERIVYAILAANGAVFLLWQYAIHSAQRFRDSRLYIWLLKNFTASYQNFTSGRIWTLITPTFSHEGFGHILVNSLCIWFFAPPVMALLGNAGFVATYLAGGAIASIFSVSWKAFKHRSGNSHGASGAANTLLAMYACAYPTAQILFYFVLPIPAWVFVPAYFGWELWSSMSNRSSMIDSPGHVGGILAGVAFFLMRRRIRF